MGNGGGHARRRRTAAHRRQRRRRRRSRFRAATRPRRGDRRSFAARRASTILRFTSYDAQGDVLDRWTQDVTVPRLGAASRWRWRRRASCSRDRRSSCRALQSRRDATPAASRRLRKTDRLLVELEAYSADGAPGTRSSSCSIRRATAWSRCRCRHRRHGRHRVEIPLQSLAPATYVLHVTAKTADKQVEQHVPFRIVP